MPAPFLGTGLAFPIDVAAGGRLGLAAQEAGVAQAVWLILATARGERRMRPDFGCGIHDLMFQNAGNATAARIAREVRDALSRLEPRIEVEEIAVTPGDVAASLLIDVRYRIRASNSLQNLVYPFYLGGQP